VCHISLSPTILFTRANIRLSFPENAVTILVTALRLCREFFLFQLVSIKLLCYFCIDTYNEEGKIILNALMVEISTVLTTLNQCAVFGISTIFRGYNINQS